MTFYEEIAKLKTFLRRGWLMRDVDKINGGMRVESDGEHTYSMILLALEMMNKHDLKLDQLKVLKMIAYHELCEIDAGDITPFDNVTKEEKHRREHQCIKRLAKEYKMPEIETIWLEFEEENTPEAKFVKKIDHYDAVLQAKIYSKMKGDNDLYDEFHGNCAFSEKLDKFDL